jgi:glycosyltransferase involved in cell wall biosynthesis
MVNAKMYKMMLSIIVPMFNCGFYIRKCLHSIKSQICNFDYEIIVIDDCSTDDSVSIVREIFGDIVTLLLNEKNMGPSYCRNKGIKASKGKYLALIDSDDWLDLYRMQILINFAESKNCIICSDGNINIKENHRIKSIYPYWFLLRSKKINIINFINYDFGPLKPIIKSDYIKQRQIFYNEDLKYSEDFDFYFRILLSGTYFWFIPVYLNYRLIHKGSLSDDKQQLHDKSFESVIDYLKINHLTKKAKIALLKRAKNFLMQRSKITYMFHYFYKIICFILFKILNDTNKRHYLK